MPESCTERVPLLGADGYEADWNRRHHLAERHGLHVARVEDLLHRYGGLVHELLALIVAERPALAEPLEHAPDHLRAEVVYAVQAEGALHLDDVLARRTRISIEVADRGVAAATEVAALVAPLLGWDETGPSGRSCLPGAGRGRAGLPEAGRRQQRGRRPARRSRPAHRHLREAGGQLSCSAPPRSH